MNEQLIRVLEVLRIGPLYEQVLDYLVEHFNVWWLLRFAAQEIASGTR